MGTVTERVSVTGAFIIGAALFSALQGFVP
jgi:hypothetical protein